MTRRKLEIVALKNEAARLRAVIKAAEWQGDVHDEPACPWCHAERHVSQGDDGKHAPDCPAFTVEGLVR